MTARGEDEVAPDDAGQDVLLLLLAAEGEDGLAGEDDGGEVGAGKDGAAHFDVDGVEIEEAAAGAGVLLRIGEAEPVEGGHLLPELLGVAGAALFELPDDLGSGVGSEEVAGRLLDGALLFVEGEVHGRPPIAGGRGRGWPGPCA